MPLPTTGSPETDIQTSMIPSSSPSLICQKGVVLVESSDDSSVPDSPVSVLGVDGDIVSFSIEQVFDLDCSIDTIAVMPSVFGEKCHTASTVIPGEMLEFQATCTNEKAMVEIFLYDPSFQRDDDVEIPDLCGSFNEDKNWVSYTYSIPCGCKGSAVPTSTPAPTSGCDYLDLSFDDKDLAPGSYVSLQWKEYGLRLEAGELAPGTGGYIPNGKPRLFDTSRPTDDEDFGTPLLSGDFGNVLIVQQDGGNHTQWKANEEGGVIQFHFVSPIQEVSGVGLLNVVEATWVRATHADRSSTTIAVHESPAAFRKVDLHLRDVIKLEVIMQGASAIVDLQLCGQLSFSNETNVNSPVPSLATPFPSRAPSLSSQAPSTHMSSSPTSMKCERSPRDEYHDLEVFPITIIEADGESVSFEVSQVLTTNCSVSWLATSYQSDDSVQRCDSQTDVVPDQAFVYEAKCSNNVAKVILYAQDPTFDSLDNITVPAVCGGANNGQDAHFVSYSFALPCDCPDHLSGAPSMVPNESCFDQDVSFDSSTFAPGAYVSLQWQYLGLRITAKQINDMSGGYIPNGYPRIFDTTRATNSTGYGTEGLQGAYGRSWLSSQPKTQINGKRTTTVE